MLEGTPRLWTGDAVRMWREKNRKARLALARVVGSLGLAREVYERAVEEVVVLSKAAETHYVEEEPAFGFVHGMCCRRTRLDVGCGEGAGRPVEGATVWTCRLAVKARGGKEPLTRGTRFSVLSRGVACMLDLNCSCKTAKQIIQKPQLLAATRSGLSLVFSSSNSRDRHVITTDFPVVRAGPK